jgi:hypothetical protein
MPAGPGPDRQAEPLDEVHGGHDVVGSGDLDHGAWHDAVPPRVEGPHCLRVPVIARADQRTAQLSCQRAPVSIARRGISGNARRTARRGPPGTQRSAAGGN